MPIEGFVLLHPRGHYALYEPNACHELHADDQLLVDTGPTWIEMEVTHLQHMEVYWHCNIWKKVE
jgi:hypothetical protein